jgi:P4 family phage/plasmid primase-like protien
MPINTKIMPINTKINSFDNYLSQFAKKTDTESEQTHLSFNKKKYNVPDSFFDEFYKKYFEFLKTKTINQNVYLIEKIHNKNFAFFMDIDEDKNKNQGFTDQNIKELINSINEIINNNYNKTHIDELNLIDNIVCKRENKYHIIYHNLIVNDTISKKLVNKIINKFVEKTNIDKKFCENCIDCSVYRTGLRMVGSLKNEDDNDKNNYYKIYDLNEQKLIEINDTTYEEFKKTIIRKKETELVIKMIENKNLKDTNSNETSIKKYTEELNKKIPVKGIENYEIVNEIKKFLIELKNTNLNLENINVDIDRIYGAQNKYGMFCYYISIKEKLCPFKQREHRRETHPIYIEIGINGIFIKCYDKDCIRKRFPDTGIRMPSDFETNYPQLYLSMNTRYWKTDIMINDDTRYLLEESLTASHYQIAKVIFHIYKDRFRIDDVKNTCWYEYDGIRWKKSHLINILISEELPKYYNCIKISDTSLIKNDDLKEYLSNNERMDLNFRNSLVDKIITKLENVNFKANVISQVSYLYKNLDPEFYTLLDNNPYLLGFSNGVYDFKLNKFREATQYDYLTFSTGYEYTDYDENCNEVKEIYEFLSKIITDKKVREYLLKVLGKSLLGLPDERFYIWTGLSGANGKSTLVNFLEQTLGEYTTSVDVSLLTNKRASSGNASPDVIRLRGKRLFSFQEPEHDDKLRTGILKQYTGGDTIIARELFKAPVTFKLQGTMVMCCNDLPSVNSIDSGTFRRIRVIEFNSRFCENPVKKNEFKIDPELKSKMINWRPYFMSILIHWYNKYLKEGLNEPESVKKATTKYKADNDKFNEFFDQCIEHDQDIDEETNKDKTEFQCNKTIYSHFTNWWLQNYSNARIPEIKELIRALKIKFGNEKEETINGIRNYGFNIKLKNTQFNENFINEDL